ncbi:MAG TPA: NERD domain-containing protein [Streptomyces sp.]
MKPAQQWFQERPPPYSWEQEALDRVRRLMPAVEPHRAWATFSFAAQAGRVNECDLLVAVPAGLFLLESKSHPGKLRNTGFTWNFHGKDRIRTIHNPLHFNDVKTKELRSQPQWAARRLYKDDRVAVPHIEPAVFLSAPGLASHLDEVQRLRVFRRLPLPNLRRSERRVDTTTARPSWLPGSGYASPPTISPVSPVGAERGEDRTGQRLDIAVPPKYWSH